MNFIYYSLLNKFKMHMNTSVDKLYKSMDTRKYNQVWYGKNRLFCNYKIYSGY
jgi:hypothetical protein